MVDNLETENLERLKVIELINSAIASCFQNPVVVPKYVAPTIYEALAAADLLKPNHLKVIK